MKKEIETRINHFITNNNLTFNVGERNTHSVILSGYCLYLGVIDSSEIISTIVDLNLVEEWNWECEEEFERVFDYAINNNYGEYWRTPEAKKLYNF